MIRLCNPVDFGAHHHAGWPWIRSHLAALESDGGLPLDDAVEFSYRAGKRSVAPVREWPWAAIFHQPEDFPSWFPGYPTSPRAWMDREAWRRSAPHLCLAVAMCRPLARWLEARLERPATVLLHPAAPPRARFDPARFAARPRVVQLGHQLRNLEAIHQLRPVAGVEYVDVQLAGPVAERRRRAVADYWAERGGRTRHPGVTRWERVDDAAYEDVLAGSVVFLELFAAAAVNVVVECAVRATPVVVNRLPALEDYLGTDYPLFYDAFDEAHRLIDAARLRAGHEHLRGLDVEAFGVDRFVEGLRGALEAAVPEAGRRRDASR